MISKSGYRVERGERGRSRSESRTDNEDNNDNEKGKEGEINFTKEKNFIVAKVKNTVMLQPRMG